jgi:hypothetical protein
MCEIALRRKYGQALSLSNGWAFEKIGPVLRHRIIHNISGKFGRVPRNLSKACGPQRQVMGFDAQLIIGKRQGLLTQKENIVDWCAVN